jgi:hypothetical protein
MGDFSSAELSLFYFIAILFMVVGCGNSNNTKKEENFIYNGPSSDGLVKNNTRQHLMFSLNGNEQGYTGTFSIAVNAKQSGQ